MKNLVAKLKGMKFQQLALEHGEKVGLGSAGLFVLICLAMTSWQGYARAPEELVEKARQADSQLLKNEWPELDKNEFEVVDVMERAIRQLMDAVSVKKFAYDPPMSPKLYQREQPISEPVFLPVEDLLARPGQFVLHGAAKVGKGDELVDASEAEGKAEMEAAKPAPAEDEDAETKRRDSVSPKRPAAEPNKNPTRDLMGKPSTDSHAARGIRYVSVVGIVPFRLQVQKIMEAEHLESINEALEYIEYLDFKIERQRAVSGNDPWVGPWDLLSIQTAVDVLQEAISFDPDVVSTDVTDPVFTMPLPARLNGYWTDKVVSHPRLEAYLLTEKEKQEELAKESALIQMYDEKGMEDTDAAGKKGFHKQLRDVAAIRRKLQGKVSTEDLLNRANENLGQAGMGIMARGQAGSMGVGGHGPKLILFRYLDFAVEPGDCYRYRVQLVVRNPNYDLGLDQVQEASVAAGETRETAPSLPSPPVAIESDVKYFVIKVPRFQRRPANKAEIEMIQWDPKVGTLIDGTMQMLFGQYIGGKKKVRVLNVAVPSLNEEDAVFSSKDLLVDSAGAPPAAAAEHSDLALGSKEWKELFDDGKLDQAVTVNPSGELVARDTVSVKGELQRERRRIERERKEYAELEDKAEEVSPLDRMRGNVKSTQKDEKRARLQDPRRASAGGNMTTGQGAAAGDAQRQQSNAATTKR